MLGDRPRQLDVGRAAPGGAAEAAQRLVAGDGPPDLDQPAEGNFERSHLRLGERAGRGVGEALSERRERLSRVGELARDDVRALAARLPPGGGTPPAPSASIAIQRPAASERRRATSRAIPIRNAGPQSGRSDAINTARLSSSELASAPTVFLSPGPSARSAPWVLFEEDPSPGRACRPQDLEGDETGGGVGVALGKAVGGRGHALAGQPLRRQVQLLGIE